MLSSTIGFGPVLLFQFASQMVAAADRVGLDYNSYRRPAFAKCDPFVKFSIVFCKRTPRLPEIDESLVLCLNAGAPVGSGVRKIIVVLSVRHPQMFPLSPLKGT